MLAPCKYFLVIRRRGVVGKREETRLPLFLFIFFFFFFVRMNRRPSLRKGGKGRPNQLSRAYRCRAGRLERIRPCLNGSLSLFPSSSLTNSPLSNTYYIYIQIHTLNFLPHHHILFLSLTPSQHHFSGMRRHFFSY